MLLTVDQFVQAVGEVEADNVAGIGPRDERTIDAVKVEEALAFTDQLIRAKIAARYPVVPSQAAAMIGGFAIDIALYRLRYKTGDTSGVSDETARRYKAALAELEKIGAGAMLLPGAEAIGGNAAAVPLPVLSSREPARAPQILDGWLS